MKERKNRGSLSWASAVMKAYGVTRDDPVPRKVRIISVNSLANLACHLNRPLYDAGNISCDQGRLEQMQHEQAVRVRDLLNRGHFPLLLGGRP